MDIHHIVPRSKQGSDRAWNLLTVCPGCHRKIYIPNMNTGIHKSPAIGSIEIFGYLSTSDGQAVHYRMVENGLEFLWVPKTSENILLETPMKTT